MFVLCTALAAGPTAAALPKLDPVFAAVATAARPLVGRPWNDHLGGVVGVRHRGRDRVFGFGTVTTPARTGRPDGSTILPVGSVTKTVTGVLLAEAVRRGEVKLTDPANDHLPAALRLPTHPAGPITLLDLATHRSGLPRMTPDFDPADAANPYLDYTRADLAAGLPAVPLKNRPGRRYEYSNLGAGVLGHALVHAANAKSFDALVRDRVAGPLGMTDTAEALTGEQLARQAVGFDAYEPHPAWDFAALQAAGALRSTVPDLLKYAAAVTGESWSAVSPAVRDSTARRRRGSSAFDSVGLFWLLTGGPGEVLQTGAVVSHMGQVGHTAAVWVRPADRVAVVALYTDAGDRAGGALTVLVSGVATAAANATK